MKQLRSWHLSAVKVISDPMSALARTSEKDCRTRTTNENCTANESWTRTKYAYDAAGRRASLTVPGQADANYTFDNANRLMQINQGSATVSFIYDNAGRRTTM